VAREAKVKLEADAKGFKTAVTGAANHLKAQSQKIQASWGKVKNRTSSVIGSFKKLSLVAGGVIVSLGAIIKTSANTGDAFQKMALRTGASIEFLSGMSHVAQLAGSNIGTMENAIRLLSKRMLDADEGLAEAAGSFERLNINIHDSEGNLRAIEDIFPDVIQAFGDLTNETEKVALAQELFGRSGTQLLPLIKQGTDAINDQMNEAKALGLVWSQDTADAAAEFNDQQLRLVSGFKGIKNAVANALIPTFIEWMESGTERIKEFIKTDLPGFVKRVQEGFEKLVPKIESFVKKLWDIGKFVIEHGDVIAKIFVVATIVITTVKLALLVKAIWGLVAASTALTFTPTGAILTGLALLAGVFVLITSNADEASASVKQLSGLGADAGGNFEGTDIPSRFGPQTDRPTIASLGGFIKDPSPRPKMLDLNKIREAVLANLSKEGDKEIELTIKGDGMREFATTSKEALIPLIEGFPMVSQDLELINVELAGLQVGFGDFAATVGSNFDIMRRAAFNFTGRTRQNFSEFFRGMADESTTASQVWSQLWENMKATALGALSEILIDFATKKALEVALHGTAEKQKTLLTQKGTIARMASSALEIGKSLLSAAASMVAAIAAGFRWLVTTLGPFGLAAGIVLGAGLIAAFNSIKGRLGFEKGGLIPRYAIGGLILAGSVLPLQMVEGTDSLLIRATPGEYVVREPIVRQYGAGNIDEWNRTGDISALIRSFPGRQSGGLVDMASTGVSVRDRQGGVIVNLYFTREQKREDAEYIRQVVGEEVGRVIQRKGRLREI